MIADELKTGRNNFNQAECYVSEPREDRVDEIEQRKIRNYIKWRGDEMGVFL